MLSFDKKKLSLFIGGFRWCRSSDNQSIVSLLITPFLCVIIVPISVHISVCDTLRVSSMSLCEDKAYGTSTMNDHPLHFLERETCLFQYRWSMPKLVWKLYWVPSVSTNLINFQLKTFIVLMMKFMKLELSMTNNIIHNPCHGFNQFPIYKPTLLR